MQQREPGQDERVARGPAEPDGGVSDKAAVPLGGASGLSRGVVSNEDLGQAEQQPGLDAPYGTRTSTEEQAALEHEPGPRPAAPGPADQRPGTVGSGQGETPGKIAGTQL